MNFSQNSGDQKNPQAAKPRSGHRDCVVIPIDGRDPYTVIDGKVRRAPGKVRPRDQPAEYGRERSESEHAVIRQLVRLQRNGFHDPAGDVVQGRFGTTYPVHTEDRRAA